VSRGDTEAPDVSCALDAEIPDAYTEAYDCAGPRHFGPGQPPIPFAHGASIGIPEPGSRAVMGIGFRPESIRTPNAYVEIDLNPLKGAAL